MGACASAQPQEEGKVASGTAPAAAASTSAAATAATGKASGGGTTEQRRMSVDNSSRPTATKRNSISLKKQQRPANRALLEAVKNGQLAVVEKLLKDPSVDPLGVEQDTGLQVCALNLGCCSVVSHRAAGKTWALSRL